MVTTVSEFEEGARLTVSTAGQAVMVVGLVVLFTGLFVSMSTLVGLFLILAGIVTMIQGANMKPIETKAKAESKTFTLGNRKDTKGALSFSKNKGAI